jgi:hypothetical protein
MEEKKKTLANGCETLRKSTDYVKNPTVSRYAIFY